MAFTSSKGPNTTSHKIRCTFQDILTSERNFVQPHCVPYFQKSFNGLLRHQRLHPCFTVPSSIAFFVTAVSKSIKNAPIESTNNFSAAPFSNVLFLSMKILLLTLSAGPSPWYLSTCTHKLSAAPNSIDNFHQTLASTIGFDYTFPSLFHWLL